MEIKNQEVNIHREIQKSPKKPNSEKGGGKRIPNERKRRIQTLGTKEGHRTLRIVSLNPDNITYNDAKRSIISTSAKNTDSSNKIKTHTA